MKACPACCQYCADQKTVCPKCGGSLESASDFHRAHPEQHDHEINELTAALTRDPGDSAARRKLIELYQAQGNWPQVAAHLRVLAEADPHDAALQAALVDVLGLAGRGAEAALVLRGLRVKHPDDQELQQKLDDILTWLPLEGLEAAHQPPLAQLWVEAGDAKRQTGDLDAAADFYHKAHIADEHSGALRRLAEVYGQQATDWERQGRSDLALAALETALRCAPGDAALETRRAAILNRRKRRRIMAVIGLLVALLLLGGLGAYLYAYQGTVSGHLSIPAKAALIYDGGGGVRYTANPFQMTWQRRGEAVWQGDADSFVTAMIPGGHYRLIVEKPGYRRVEQPVTVGWGRKVFEADIALTPVYGAIKVNSDPSGVNVAVSIADEIKHGTTPCVFDHLPAMAAEISLGLHDGFLFTKKVEIPADQTLDVGTIALKSSLTINSTPPGGEVFIDKQRIGTTPLAAVNVSAQRHELSVTLPGGGIYRSIINPMPQEPLDLGTVRLASEPISSQWCGLVEHPGMGHFLMLNLKAASDGKLHAIGQMDCCSEWMTGEAAGGNIKLSGAQSLRNQPNAQAMARYNMEGALSQNGRKLIGTITEVNGPSYQFELSRQNDAVGYGIGYNENQRYFFRFEHSSDDGSLIINGSEAVWSGDYQSGGWIDITPCLKRGENLIEFQQQRPIDFALKRVQADGRETALWPAAGNRTPGLENAQKIVLPYFENGEALTAWNAANETNSYLVWTTPPPPRATASSSLGHDFLADRAIDDLDTTFWISAAGHPASQWIELEYDTPQPIGGIILQNGFRGQIGRQKGMIRKAVVVVGDKRIPIECGTVLSHQTIMFERTWTKSLRLIIEDIYPDREITSAAIAYLRPICLQGPIEPK